MPYQRALRVSVHDTAPFAGAVIGGVATRQSESSASLRGAPVNWISWPAPRHGRGDAPMRSARSSQMASKPALWPPETTSFGNGAAASSARGRSAFQIGRPRRRTGTSGHGGGEELGRKLVRVAADRLEEPDDPLLVGEVEVPDAANPVDE